MIRKAKRSKRTSAEIRKLPRCAGVYCIRCARTDDAYVGCSYNVYMRVSSHFQALARGDHDSRRMQAIYDLYGSGSLTFQVVEKTNDLTRERHWIERIKPTMNKVLPRVERTTDVKGRLVLHVRLPPKLTKALDKMADAQSPPVSRMWLIEKLLTEGSAEFQ